MRTIGGEEMLSLLQQAVSERGDAWVYPDTNACRYYYNPLDVGIKEDAPALATEFGEVAQPACAVGLALSYITEMDIIEFIIDREANAEQCVHLMRNINENGLVTFTDAAIAVAESMQISQDEGICWGDSLIKAKEMLIEFQEIEKRANA